MKPLRAIWSDIVLIKSKFNLFVRRHLRESMACTTALCMIVLMALTQCNDRHSALNVPKKVSFNFDVRPILVRNCYLCHGPDPSSRKADLRLDIYEGATASNEEGIHPIVPGSIRKSELVRRINHADPEVVMPPPETNMKLSDYEIAVLEKWIDQGAEWTPHWSLIPPKINSSSKTENLIDFYIDREIVDKGLTPATEASPHQLLRRVSYTLTGLPPEPAMLSKFLSDKSPDAYERIVDHYLDSKAFGERWARHWMDIVRYAETKGHEFDYTVLGAWQYRDLQGYTSVGAGSSILDVRLNCLPEVTIHELARA